MNEKTVVNALVKSLRSLGAHVQRIEDSISPGIPDINYCYQGHEGWIEVKYLEKYPVRPDTKIKLKHYTPEQALWVRLRARARGHVWLILRVEGDYYILNPEWALVFQREGLTRSELVSYAQYVWQRTINMSELLFLHG